MSKWECMNCGHIGEALLIHDDEKCEKCISRNLVEITEDKAPDNNFEVSTILNSLTKLNNSSSPINLSEITSLQEALAALNEKRISQACDKLFAEIKEKKECQMFDFILNTFNVTNISFDKLNEDGNYAEVIYLDGSVEIALSTVFSDFGHNFMASKYQYSITNELDEYVNVINKAMNNPDDALIKSFTMKDFEKFLDYVSKLLREVSNQELFIEHN